MPARSQVHCGGCWRDADKTAASSHAGGWFRIGDAGHVDAEGFVSLTDRKQVMIASGGENIASSEVERVPYQLPQALEAAAVGRPDAQWGERVATLVVLRTGATLTLEELQALCRGKLGGFQLPL